MNNSSNLYRIHFASPVDQEIYHWENLSEEYLIKLLLQLLPTTNAGEILISCDLYTSKLIFIDTDIILYDAYIKEFQNIHRALQAWSKKNKIIYFHGMPFFTKMDGSNLFSIHIERPAKAEAFQIYPPNSQLVSTMKTLLKHPRIPKNCNIYIYKDNVQLYSLTPRLKSSSASDDHKIWIDYRSLLKNPSITRKIKWYFQSIIYHYKIQKTH